MKLLAILLSSFFTIGVMAQQDITDKVSSALEAGSAQQLGAYFSANVDLTLPDEEDVFAKDQAIKYIDNFFAGHAPSAFEVIHRGTSKLNDHFRIGELKTAKGLYRVTFFMKKDGNEFKISQFRIEEADED